MIVLIDNYDSFTYNLYHILLEHDKDVLVKRNDKISIEELNHMKPDAIVISPGPGYPADAGLCIEIIQQFSGRIPILGVCLGHQAIVEAFGGKIIRADRMMHGKASRIEHEGRGLFVNMPKHCVAGRYHSLVAEPHTLPSVLEVDAQSEGVIMAVRHQVHPTFGIQFHPESVLTPDGGTLIQDFIERVRSCCNPI